MTLRKEIITGPVALVWFRLISMVAVYYLFILALCSSMGSRNPFSLGKLLVGSLYLVAVTPGRILFIFGKPYGIIGSAAFWAVLVYMAFRCRNEKSRRHFYRLLYLFLGLAFINLVIIFFTSQMHVGT